MSPFLPYPVGYQAQGKLGGMVQAQDSIALRSAIGGFPMLRVAARTRPRGYQPLLTITSSESMELNGTALAL